MIYEAVADYQMSKYAERRRQLQDLLNKIDKQLKYQKGLGTSFVGAP